MIVDVIMRFTRRLIVWSDRIDCRRHGLEVDPDEGGRAVAVSYAPGADV